MTVLTGVKSHYKLGTTGDKAVDNWVQLVDGRAAVVGEEGPCHRRLASSPSSPVLGSIWRGKFWCPHPSHPAGHLQGVTMEPPSHEHMGLEVTNICRRLSTPTVQAARLVLLARVSQVGQLASWSAWPAGVESGSGGRSGRCNNAPGGTLSGGEGSGAAEGPLP